MSLPTMSQDALMDAAFNLQLVSYFHVVSVAVLVYDYLITLAMEINYIWSSPFSVMKVLFLLQRYMPFIDTCGLVLLRQFVPKPNDTMCLIYYEASGWMFSASMAFSEIILTSRAWAVSGRTRTLAILLPIFFVICWLPSIIIQERFFRTVTFGPANGLASNERGCFVRSSQSYSWICWVLLMVYETGLLAVMAVACMRNWCNGGRNTLAKIVYRDGILYYIYLFGLSLTNVIVILFAPKTLLDLLGSLERVLYSVLTSRVILHIREHADSRRQNDDLCHVYPSHRLVSSTSALHTQHLQEGVLVSQTSLPQSLDDGIGIAI